MKLKWHGARVKATISRAAARGLFIGASYGLQESNRVVPIEEGTLQRSGFVDVDPGALSATIAYDTPYAKRQHEDMSLRHDQGRKAKFLEDTMKQRGRTMFELVGREIAKVAR